VAAGIGFASVGSDTGGSIRIPASFCGCVGFKPSFGVVPLSAALHLSPTCDHAGPLARSVADAHAVLEVLAARVFALEPPHDWRDVRVGVPRAFLNGRLGVAVRHAFEQLLERLKAAGAEIVNVAPAGFDLARDAYGPIVRGEAAFVHRDALEHHQEGFSSAVRDLLEQLRGMSLDAYLWARELRARVAVGLERTLRQVDVMLLPAAPLPAPPRGTKTVLLESGLQAHRNAFLELTLPFSLVGVPTLSLPFVWLDGLPVGVQVVGATGADAQVLGIGQALEAWLAAGEQAG
jgi:aspartyl-tRNA(Asn)/glutamyl-tRNA(Gln) amidotransferase subunit A